MKISDLKELVFHHDTNTSLGEDNWNSSDLEPSLFVQVKKNMCGKQVITNEIVLADVKTYFEELP